MILSIDTETHDPELLAKGPGGYRGKGFLVGISLFDGEQGIYLSLAHESGNMPRTQVLATLRRHLGNATMLVGANLNYDLEWLDSEFNILNELLTIPRGDVLLAAALLDENQASYSLEAVGQRFLGVGKAESGLEAYAATRGWKNAKGHMAEMPACEVRDYAIQDAKLTYDLNKHLMPLLETEGLKGVYSLEMDVSEILLRMRKQGAPINVEKAREVFAYMEEKSASAFQRLKDFAGYEVNVWASAMLARIAKDHGWPIPLTPKGNPSIGKDFLESDPDHPFWPIVLEARKWDRSGKKFVGQDILGCLCEDGRIRCSYRQTKSGFDREDTAGTRSGRLSCEKPNLQQVPGRDSEIKKLIRGLFIPLPRDRIVRLDYSAQEMRIAIGYAVLMGIPGAEDVAALYKDPTFDIYRMIAGLHYQCPPEQVTKEQRQQFKGAVLGIMYGAGAAKIAETLDIQVDDAKDILEAIKYHFPLLNVMSKRVQKTVEERAYKTGTGWVSTYGGRKRRWSDWGPKSKDFPVARPLPKDEAIRKYGQVILWGAYKGLNSIIQGTAADMTKKAMVQVYQELGLTPLLQVHDELVYSIREEAQAVRIKEIMEGVFPEFPLPIVAEMKISEKWA